MIRPYNARLAGARTTWPGLALAAILAVATPAIANQPAPPACPGGAIFCELPEVELPKDLRVPRDRDVGQAAMPFHFDGQPVTADQPEWEWYRDPIATYPDAASCLPSAAVTATHLDVAAFDWGARRTLDESEICVFRLTQVLGDWRHVAAWFLRSGLRDPEPGLARPGYQVVSDGSAVVLTGCIGKGTGPETDFDASMRSVVMLLSGTTDLNVSVVYGLDGTLQSVGVAECF